MTLTKLLPATIRAGYEPKLKLALAASRFAHDLRHAGIGHRNREVALEVKPVPRSSREQIRRAIAAIDDALHFVDHHYTGHEATTLIRPVFRERGFRRITISTSWSSAVNRFIRRSTEKPSSL